MKHFILAAIVFASISNASSYAAIVLQYNTAASTDNPSLAPASADAAVTATNLSAGSGLTAANGSTYNWNQWDPASVSFADAVAANDFWTWGFTVSGNATVALEDFDIRLDRSGTGPDDFEIQASVNGGAGVSLLTHDFGDSASGVDFTAVSLAALPTLNNGDSVVFTMAAFNSEGTGGTFDLETVDFGGSDPRALRINGTVTAVPEPSSLALLAVAGVAGAIRRRRS